MMKKFIVLAAVAVLVIANSPVLAGVWWTTGDPGTTYQKWDFTNAVVSGGGYNSVPETVYNPNLDVHDLVALISAVYPGSINYDGQGFSGNLIQVDLEIPNYENPNLYKEIWVDLGEGVAVDYDYINATGHDGPSTDFGVDILPGEGIWEFGVKIWPNPQYEKIVFTVLPPAGAGEVYLDSIEVWTICVPEPATLALLGLGGLLIRRRK